MSFLIKLFLFMDIIILIYPNDSNKDNINCDSDLTFSDNYKEKNDSIKENSLLKIYGEKLKEEFLHSLFSMFDEQRGIVDDYFYDLIESIDQECFDFALKLFFNETDFMNEFAKKVLHNRGLIQMSIGTEEDCMNDDGVYMMFTGEYNRSDLLKENSIKSNETLFRESKYIRQEVCIFTECRHLYKPLMEYLHKYQNKTLKSIFPWSHFKIEGIRYKDITEEEKVQMSETEKEKDEEEKSYLKILMIILISLAIFFFVCSIISFSMKASPKEIETINEIECIPNDNNKENLIEKKETPEEDGIDNFTLIKRKYKIIKKTKLVNLNIYKFISSFDMFQNLSILNKKEDSLHNQDKLIALSTIKLLTLFFIMLGENSYIILKYIENKMSILTFCRAYFFSPIKLGMNSYDTYKIICGIIFGFKFMNFFKKEETSTNNLFKKLGIFFTKHFPYVIIFFIIHFMFNYPIFIYLKNVYNDIKVSYLSSIMKQCSCQQEPFKLFNVFSIISEYNSTEFNIGQFNGCSRPILFAISETFCFYIVLLIAFVNVLFNHKKIKINICYIILFILNFIYLGLTYFVTKEVKDLTKEYSISRLFGLSGSIAMPHLFFPLYYIGFNIGIIYYYQENLIENKDFIPFEYCYYIADGVKKMGEILQIIFMLVLIGLIILCSFSFKILTYTMPENYFLFTFSERPIAKFVFIYKGIIQAIFFSFLILIYLSSEFYVKRIFSSEFFNFVNKISFTFFISFISVLYYFHILGFMEIYLTPFSVITNTIILFLIACLLSIIISCVLFFPIKKIYYYITKGFDDKKMINELKEE